MKKVLLVVMIVVCPISGMADGGAVSVTDLKDKLGNNKGCGKFGVLQGEVVHPDTIRQLPPLSDEELEYVGRCILDLRAVLKVRYKSPCKDRKPHCTLIRDATRTLVAAEGALRSAANRRVERQREVKREIDQLGKNQEVPDIVEALQPQVANKTDPDPHLVELQGEASKLARQIRAVDRLINFSGDQLIANREAYPNLYFRIPVGYEFVDVEEGFDEGFPRLGLWSSFRFGSSRAHDGLHGVSASRYGLTLGVGIEWTNSAEQKLTTDDTMTTPEPETTTAEVADSLLVQTELWWPMYRSRNRFDNDIRMRIGPVLTLGGRKTDDEGQIDGRYYGGARFSVNPEAYVDVMYGRTASLDSQRAELRGQLPIAKLKNQSRVFVGLIANLGIDSERDAVFDDMGMMVRAAEPDVVRLYLEWNGEPTKVFSSFFGSIGD